VVLNPISTVGMSREMEEGIKESLYRMGKKIMKIEKPWKCMRTGGGGGLNFQVIITQESGVQMGSLQKRRISSGTNRRYRWSSLRKGTGGKKFSEESEVSSACGVSKETV